MKHFKWNRFQTVVGNTSIWLEAAATLRQLAQMHDVHMNPDVRFHEPYIGADEMPGLLDQTYQSTRS
jgi:hypothetical protein